MDADRRFSRCCNWSALHPSNIVWSLCRNRKTPTGYIKGSGVRLHGYWWINHSSQHSTTYSDRIHWTPMESSGFQWVPLDCCSHCGGSSSSHCTVVVFVVDGVGIGRCWQNSKGSGVGLGRTIMVVDSPLPILVRLTRHQWIPVESSDSSRIVVVIVVVIVDIVL